MKPWDRSTWMDGLRGGVEWRVESLERWQMQQAVQQQPAGAVGFVRFLTAAPTACVQLQAKSFQHLSLTHSLSASRRASLPTSPSASSHALHTAGPVIPLHCTLHFSLCLPLTRHNRKRIDTLILAITHSQ